MAVKLVLKYVNIADLSLCLGVLLVLFRRGKVRDFPSLTGLVAARAASLMFSIPLCFFRKDIGLSIDFAYNTYFASFWTFFALQSVLLVLTIYGIYRSAMKPLPGLQRIGQIIFRWVAGVSAGISVFFAVGPHTGIQWFDIAATQIQQGISVLALCLLLFVCLAIRPLGLTFRSQLFGVSLGLGVTSAVALVQSAWLSTTAGHALYSLFYVYTGCASLISLTIWATYFLMREPERRLVLLPTTSPFFTWNSISEALGDDPGFVAVSGFTPDMLAPAELEALSSSFTPRDEEEGEEGAPDENRFLRSYATGS